MEQDALNLCTISVNKVGKRHTERYRNIKEYLNQDSTGLDGKFMVFCHVIYLDKC